MNRKKGFSLIELSVVLVILGLLIATVTVGKDLIRSAAMRAVITQITDLQTQLGAFLLRYNALPGDITNADKRGLGN